MQDDFKVDENLATPANLQARNQMLPIQLTPLEEFFVVDDCPEYRMHVIVRMRFAGQLNRAVFEQALAQAFALHPLATAKVEWVNDKVATWVPAVGWRPTVEWDTVAVQDGLPESRCIDMTRTPGIRILHVDRDGDDDLVWQVHHSCSDARGLTQLTEDVLLFYAAAMDAPHGKLPTPIDHFGFRFRSIPGTTRWKYIRQVHKYPQRVGKGLSIAYGNPVGLGNGSRLKSSEISPSPSYECFDFCKDETDRILSGAKALGVTVNSFLIRDMFSALAGCSQQENWGADALLRLCVPIDLRRYGASLQSVSNAFGCAFLDRRASALKDTTAVLQSLHEEVARTTQDEKRYLMQASLLVIRSIPGGFSRLKKPGRTPWATCLFSNLGVLFPKLALPRQDGQIVAGNVRLKRWDLLPPVMRRINLAVCPSAYAGRLSFTTHFNERLVSRSEIRGLMGEFVERIRWSSNIKTLRAAA